MIQGFLVIVTLCFCSIIKIAQPYLKRVYFSLNFRSSRK